MNPDFMALDDFVDTPKCTGCNVLVLNEREDGNGEIAGVVFRFGYETVRGGTGRYDLRMPLHQAVDFLEQAANIVRRAIDKKAKAR